MKRTFNFLTILTLTLTLTTVFTSCKKNQPVLTLEELYPDWANLTWVSTDGVTAEMNPDVYPRLNITIVGDVVTIDHLIDSDGGIHEQGDKITIENNEITFQFEYYEMVGTFSKNDNKITISTYGIFNQNDPNNFHTYVLQIN